MVDSELGRRLGPVEGLAARRAVILAMVEARPREAFVKALAAQIEAARHDARAAGPLVAVASFILRLREQAPTLIDELRAAAADETLLRALAMLSDPPAERSLAPAGRLPDVALSARASLELPVPDGGPLGPGNATFVDRVCRHPDPVMIARLLERPWCSASLVVRVAARRPSTPGIVRELVHADRWLARADVRRALVENPFTPGGVVQALLPTVGARSWRALARGVGSSAQAARSLLDRSAPADLGG